MKPSRLLCAIVAAASVVGCGGGTSSSSTPSASVPADLSAGSFDVNFTYMPKLKNLQLAGHGLVGVILPDLSSGTRYATFDQPFLKQAFDAAGYSPAMYTIDGAQNSSDGELTLAKADITKGARVLIVDPLDAKVGAQIQTYAQANDVKVISYDRATFAGTATYYVGFDAVQVGKLIGEAFVQCVVDWKVTHPKVFVLDAGEDTDPSAVAVAQGYNQVIWGDATTPLDPGKTNDRGYKLIAERFAPGSDSSKGASIFKDVLHAHPDISATVEANDSLADAVIGVLKSTNVQPKTVPTTGDGASLQGMANVLTGYQCGSVYRAPYLQAQDAVALATVLRAGATPPAALINGKATPPAGVTGTQQPASLLSPVWVNAANMEGTVIKDKFISVTALCTLVGATVCQANNIS